MNTYTASTSTTHYLRYVRTLATYTTQAIAYRSASPHAATTPAFCFEA